jgi:hypothetical protein
MTRMRQSHQTDGEREPTKEISTLQKDSTTQEESSTKPKYMTVHAATEKDRESNKANKSGQEEVAVKATDIENQGRKV